MSESSIFWTTGTTGDGANPYTMAQVGQWLRDTFVPGQEDGGILLVSDKLEVAAVTGGVTVAAGSALHYGGFFYRNTAQETVSIPTPVSNTRVDRIVLRADWTAQTVRITRIAGTEGAGAPSIQQSLGNTYDIPLAQVSITTAGNITVTDERQFCRFATEVGTENLADSAVTEGKIADSAVTAAKIANRTRKFLVSMVPTPLAEVTITWGITMTNLNDSFVVFSFIVPYDFASGLKIAPIFMSGSSAGNAYISVEAKVHTLGVSGSDFYEQYEAVGLEANVPSRLTQIELDGTRTAPGAFVQGRVSRDADNPLDTLDNDIYYLGVEVEYVADS